MSDSPKPRPSDTIPGTKLHPFVRWNMLGVSPRPVSALHMQLGTCFQQVPAECRDQLRASSLASSSQHEPVPFVQLSYQEIPMPEIHRLLGYAGISSANGPIGLDAEFLPHTIGPDPLDPQTQFLLFPLSGLERHLVAQEPRVAESLQTLGSMDAFAHDRGDAMTAIEY